MNKFISVSAIASGAKKYAFVSLVLLFAFSLTQDKSIAATRSSQAETTGQGAAGFTTEQRIQRNMKKCSRGDQAACAKVEKLRKGKK